MEPVGTLSSDGEGTSSDWLLQKVVCLREMLELTNNEQRAIKKNNGSSLKAVIRKKQVLMQKIDRLDAKITSLKPDNSHAEALPESDHLVEAKEVLSQLFILETENQELLKKTFSGMKVELNQLQQHKQVKQVYNTKETVSKTDFISR